MATEVLVVNEELLEEFIEILEYGISTYEEKSEYEISERLKKSLLNWIQSEKKYIKRISNEE
jgi:hypothetical protein